MGVDKHSSWKVCYVLHGRGGSSVNVVFFCCGDNFEEDLLWEPKLGVFCGPGGVR